MNEHRAPSLLGSSQKDSPSLTGWGMSASSGDQERTMASYSEMLKDPRWQRRRLERLEASGWACATCGDKTKTLHVHHRRYVKGRKPWEYSDEELVVLCERCHEWHHEERSLLDQVIAAGGELRIADLMIVCAAHLDSALEISTDLANQARAYSDPIYPLVVLANWLRYCGDGGQREFAGFIESMAAASGTPLSPVDQWAINELKNGHTF